MQKIHQIKYKSKKIVVEIKERIEAMEIERISAVDLGIIPYEA